MRRLLVSFFGLGYGPVAPGTWGSLGAVAIYFALHLILGGVPWWVLVVMIAAAAATNLCLGDWAISHYRSNDPKPVVIDEVAGMWTVLLLVPVGEGVSAAWICAAAFLVFRLFDILKLPPAKQLERLSAGAGILADDLAAAVQTSLVLWIGLIIIERLD